MARRITATQRLVTFAMEVTEAELNQVIEVIQAIRASRFPVVKRTPRKPRAIKIIGADDIVRGEAAVARVREVTGKSLAQCRSMLKAADGNVARAIEKLGGPIPKDEHAASAVAAS